MKLSTWISEFGYWHVTRHTRKFVPWAARNLPYKVRYWVIIYSAAKVNKTHTAITWTDMLQSIEKENNNA